MQTLKKNSLLQGGKYKVERILGQGGFGITYEGIQEGLGRRVAIKEFFMKDYCDRDANTNHVTVGTEGLREMVNRYREKFVKEARMIAALDRAPHIVRIYDIFEENQTAYYVMEFVEGGSLESLVKSSGPLSEERAFELIMQTAKALSSLHQRQIMHLDVKPANILLRKDEQGDDDIVLIDFGISKHYDPKGKQTTTTPVGFSKGYAPLEQYRDGGVQAFSPTTDIYSLGATLYYLLTGYAPMEATDLADDPLQKPSSISDYAWQVINKAMQSSRKQRFQSMEEMMTAMKQKTGEPVAKTDSIQTKSSESHPTRVAKKQIQVSEETVVSEKNSGKHHLWFLSFGGIATISIGVLAAAFILIILIKPHSTMSPAAAKAWSDFKAISEKIATPEAANQFKNYDDFNAAVQEWNAAAQEMAKYTTEYSKEITDSMDNIATTVGTNVQFIAELQQAANELEYAADALEEAAEE